MQALRRIHQMTSNTLTISVPEAFQNCRMEIIMLPLDEIISPKMVQNKGWRDKLARATQIRTTIAARRNRESLTPAVDIINQTREEQNEYFDNLC